MSEAELPVRGHTADRSDLERLSAALLAAVDYRGDITLILTDESSMEGYLFDLNGDRLVECDTFRVEQALANFPDKRPFQKRAFIHWLRFVLMAHNLAKGRQGSCLIRRAEHVINHSPESVMA